MKKLFALMLAALFTSALLCGCGAADNSTVKPGGLDENTKQSGGDASASFANIKQAAKDAGYEVSDEYFFSPDGVKDGFSVTLYLKSGDTHASVFEFENADAANKYAKEIDDAGHNIAIVSGSILSMYDAKDKTGNYKSMMESIVKGAPIAPVNEQE